jgi:hypothetical protein
VFVDGRWVGIVYRDAKPPAEFDESLLAKTLAVQEVASVEEGVRVILEYAAARPEHEIR